jgi:drug/metabolite transporter (DMT)-like permease
MDKPGMRSGTATTLGLGAVLLWASLASLTALKGPIPPLQTTGMVFAVAAVATTLIAVLRGRLSYLKPTLGSLLLGVYGLFGYHALYFAALRLAPPAEAHLISSLWALLTVLFSGFLPGSRLRAAHVIAAIIGFSGAASLVWDQLGTGHFSDSALTGFGFALGCAVVWSTYSLGSRFFADVPSESIAVSCLAVSLLALGVSWRFEAWLMPAGAKSWLAILGLGLGPVGTAFLLWDVGMKKGNVPLLGVLSYASPIISTLLLIALGFAQPTWALAVAVVLMIAAAVIASRFA